MVSIEDFNKTKNASGLSVDFNENSKIYSLLPTDSN